MKSKKNSACALMGVGMFLMMLGFASGSLLAADASAGKITDKLFGYWRLDENSVNSFADASGNCAKAVPDELFCQPMMKMIPGKIGNAVAFDGIGDAWGKGIPVNCKALSGKTDEFCMAFWIQPVEWNKDKGADKPAYNRTWDKNEFIRKGHSILVRINKDDTENSGMMGFSIFKSNTWNLRSETYRLPLKQWTFVVWNFKAKEGGRLFINGKAVGSVVGEPDDAIPSEVDDMVIGRTSYNSVLDEFAIWGRVLNEAEIADLYNDGKGRAIIPMP